MSLLLKVECYAGHKADERPLRFTAIGASAHTYAVKEVLDQWVWRRLSVLQSPR